MLEKMLWDMFSNTCIPKPFQGHRYLSFSKMRRNYFWVLTGFFERNWLQNNGHGLCAQTWYIKLRCGDVIRTTSLPYNCAFARICFWVCLAIPCLGCAQKARFVHSLTPILWFSMMADFEQYYCILILQLIFKILFKGSWSGCPDSIKSLAKLRSE